HGEVCLPDGRRHDRRPRGHVMTALRLPDEAWASEQVQAALSVLSDHHALEFEKRRDADEAKARQRMADHLRHADESDLRARQYDGWAAEYPAAHWKHRLYSDMAGDQRRLKAKAMQKFRQERNSL